MADQKRWFKVWTSIVANAHFAEMSLEDIGRWTLLGASTALDGDRGVLDVPGSGKELCRVLRVDDLGAAKAVLQRLRSVHFEEGKNHHGENTVTWANWVKYQKDSTQAQRQKTSRSKRRGEEKRKEEKRGEGDARSRADSDYLESLKTDPTYAGINVVQEHGKMARWCEVNRKVPSRARFVNWLNRCERPMNGQPTPKPLFPTREA